MNKLLYSLIILFSLFSCSLQQKGSSFIPTNPMIRGKNRIPSNDFSINSCSTAFSALFKDESLLSLKEIDIDQLLELGQITIEDIEYFKESPYWLSIIQRPGMADKELELGFIGLSLIRKQNPDLAQEGIKDRYEILREFCRS
jgi:hypothetical protein